MEYRSQFQSFEKSELDEGFFERPEGFLGQHVQPLSMLVKKIESGQSVSIFPRGEFEDTQYFDSQLVDRFDALDAFDSEMSSRVSSVGATPNDKRQSASAGSVPDSEIAPQGAPSGKPSGDNFGNQETAP